MENAPDRFRVFQKREDEEYPANGHTETKMFVEEFSKSTDKEISDLCEKYDSYMGWRYRIDSVDATDYELWFYASKENTSSDGLGSALVNLLVMSIVFQATQLV